MAAVALQKIGYDASDVSVGWCWIALDAEDRLFWMLLTGKLWELLAYVALPLLYLLVRKHVSRAVGGAGDGERTREGTGKGGRSRGHDTAEWTGQGENRARTRGCNRTVTKGTGQGGDLGEGAGRGQGPKGWGRNPGQSRVEIGFREWGRARDRVQGDGTGQGCVGQGWDRAKGMGQGPLHRARKGLRG